MAKREECIYKVSVVQTPILCVTGAAIVHKKLSSNLNIHSNYFYLLYRRLTRQDKIEQVLNTNISACTDIFVTEMFADK